MKLIHLSDLHIGKRVCGISMLKEQEFIFEKIYDIISDKKPDCVIIAGDIYDRSNAGNDAVALFDRFLTELSERCPAVVVISGNHDSPERIAFASRLLEKGGVYMSPVYCGEIKPVVLEDEFGNVNIYPIPFVKPANVRAALGIEAADYDAAFGALIDSLNVDPSERNIAVVHQFIAGASRCDSEELSVGGSDSVSAERLDIFDYAALGHLHRPQKVGREAVRYCGSPLKYSASEVSDKKSVTLVELGQKGETAVLTVPLEPLHDMISLRGKFEDIIQGESEQFVHIVLTDEQDEPDAANKLRNRYPNLMTVSYDNFRTRQAANPVIAAAAALPPDQLMTRLYENQNGVPLDDIQKEVLSELIEKLFYGGGAEN